MTEALTILSWWELAEEDQPPKAYWGDDDAVTEWFKAVKQRKKLEAENRKGGEEPLEEVAMWENELARGLPGG